MVAVGKFLLFAPKKHFHGIMNEFRPLKSVLGEVYAWDGVDLRATLKEASRRGQDFIVTPLVSRDSDTAQYLSAHLLSNGQWTKDVVGLIDTPLPSVHNGFVDCCFDLNIPLPNVNEDPAEPRFNLQGAQLLTEQLCSDMEWASHLGVQAVLGRAVQKRQGQGEHPFDTMTTMRQVDNVARTVRHALDVGSTYMQFWYCLELHAHASSTPTTPVPSSSSSIGQEESFDTWTYWDRFHRTSGYHSRIGVALELPAGPVPSLDAGFLRRLSRWRGEPVKCIVVPYSLFVLNTAGLPVLPPPWTAVLKSLSLTCSNFVLIGAEHRAPDISCEQYMDGLRFFHATAQQEAQDGLCTADRLEAPAYEAYKDRLQMPLQPLRDHLGQETYETFERDTAKYGQYFHAIYNQLARHRCDHLRDEHASADTWCVRITVVGAGRGGLVDCALDACHELASRKSIEDPWARVVINAVEKNPGAVRTLTSKYAAPFRRKVRWRLIDGSSMNYADSDIDDDNGGAGVHLRPQYMQLSDEGAVDLDGLACVKMYVLTRTLTRTRTLTLTRTRTS